MRGCPEYTVPCCSPLALPHCPWASYCTVLSSCHGHSAAGWSTLECCSSSLPRSSKNPDGTSAGPLEFRPVFNSLCLYADVILMEQVWVPGSPLVDVREFILDWEWGVGGPLPPFPLEITSIVIFLYSFITHVHPWTTYPGIVVWSVQSIDCTCGLFIVIDVLYSNLCTDNSLLTHTIVWMGHFLGSFPAWGNYKNNVAITWIYPIWRAHILLEHKPRTELLGHKICMFLHLEGRVKLLSKVFALVCTCCQKCMRIPVALQLHYSMWSDF